MVTTVRLVAPRRRTRAVDGLLPTVSVTGNAHRRVDPEMRFVSRSWDTRIDLAVVAF
jgi:hypothetical protein